MKDQLIYSPSDQAGTDHVGAFVVAGDDGTAIGHVSDALKVSVENAGDINVQVDSEYAEDSASADGQFIMGAGFVRQDSLASNTSADGDWTWGKVTQAGRLYVDADISAQSVGNINVDIAEQSLAELAIGGSVADDAADSGNPLKVGGRAFSTASALSALSATNDRSDMGFDLYRRQLTNSAANVGVASAPVSVDTTLGGVSLGTPAAGRVFVTVQNQSSSNDIAVGPSGLTFASGLVIPKKSSRDFPAGEAINLYAIASAGTADVRVFSLS